MTRAKALTDANHFDPPSVGIMARTDLDNNEE